MIMYLRNNGYKKGNQSNIPNVFAFTMIRNFLNDKGYEEMRREYFIRDLTPNEVNQSMRDIKETLLMRVFIYSNLQYNCINRIWKL